MIGMDAMYEYAQTVIGASKCGAYLVATNIAVGPSMAAIIPIVDASNGLNPKFNAANNTIKIPKCAGTARIISHGRSRREPKSVIAPIPIKIKIGNNSFAMPSS